MLIVEISDKEIDLQEGDVWLINKEIGWTSFDAVKKIKNLLKQHHGIKKIKVGHAGTLDPLAEGLIVVCLGKSTKKIAEIQEQEKEYIAGLELGKTTPSFDLETEVDGTYGTGHIDLEKVQSALKLFTGKIHQIPPAYSAKKWQGKRAYEYARKGEEPELKSVEVEIKDMEVIDFDNPTLKLKIVCGKGTYIRSLARDLGTALDSGAYLSALKRTRIGNYLLEDALTIQNLEEKIKQMKIRNV